MRSIFVQEYFSVRLLDTLKPLCLTPFAGILICSAILLGEKVLIQAIAANFHERSVSCTVLVLAAQH